MIALVKPQFEAGPKNVGKGGVVRDPAIHREVLEKVLDAAVENDLGPVGLMRSPLKGPKGNVEFLLWCRLQAVSENTQELLQMVFEGNDDA